MYVPRREATRTANWDLLVSLGRTEGADVNKCLCVTGGSGVLCAALLLLLCIVCAGAN